MFILLYKINVYIIMITSAFYFNIRCMIRFFLTDTIQLSSPGRPELYVQLNLAANISNAG